MKVFTDRMILDREDFELAMEQELLSVNNGIISMYIAKRYKQVLIDNIHEKALIDLCRLHNGDLILAYRNIKDYKTNKTPKSIIKEYTRAYKS